MLILPIEGTGRGPDALAPKSGWRRLWLLVVWVQAMTAGTALYTTMILLTGCTDTRGCHEASSSAVDSVAGAEVASRR